MDGTWTYWKFPPRNLTPLRGVGRQALALLGTLPRWTQKGYKDSAGNRSSSVSRARAGWKGAENMGAPGGKLLFSLPLQGCCPTLQRTSPPPPR